MQVYTVIDVNSFLKFGILWLSSIRKIGNYSDEIIIILEGKLTPQIHERLKRQNVKIIESQNNTISCLLNAINEFTITNFSFWDIHGYFINDITKLEIQDSLIFSEDESYFAGNKESLQFLLEYNRLNEFCGFEQKLDIFNYLHVQFQPNTYLSYLNKNSQKNEEAYLDFLNNFISKNKDIYYEFYDQLYPKPNTKLITPIKHE